MIESDEQNEINNTEGKHEKKEEYLYKIKLITKQENKKTILIKIENSKLNFICYYFKDYFKISFQNSFSLEELKKKSNYFLQFTEIKGIFDEIYDNPKKGEEYLDGNENLLEKIKLIIPLPSKNYPLLEFELNKVKKEKDDLFKEYKQILNIYKNKIKINNFNSKILSMKEREKEFIKFWISPIENLKAELLFSFYDACNSQKQMGNIYGLNLCITKKARSNRAFLLLYREWDLNPHSHHWPKDFRTFAVDHSASAWTMS